MVVAATSSTVNTSTDQATQEVATLKVRMSEQEILLSDKIIEMNAMNVGISAETIGRELQAERIDNHVGGISEKHSAGNITFDPTGHTIAIGDDVQEVITQVEAKIISQDDIIKTVSASIDPEVALAEISIVKSKTFPTIGDRLEESEQDFVLNISDNAYNARLEGLPNDGIINAIPTLLVLLTKIGTNNATINFGNGVFLIGTNITIPRNVAIKFTNNARLKISSGITLTVNGPIEAGYNQIFEFVDSTSIVTVKRVTYGHGEGQPPLPMNGGYKVKPDWFGAVPDARPVNAYNSVGYYASPLGTDNTEAFKRCMDFAEHLSDYYYRDVYANVPNVIVSFRPMSGYIVKGDNPLGIQSTVATMSYMIQIEGNGAVILWEPTLQADALFRKYGRVKYPRMENFGVLLCCALDTRMGTFIATKTGEADTAHSWTQGVFKNILLGTPFGRQGFDIIFDIDIDNGSHAMDDQTLVENVQSTGYNTYLRLANNEAVDWKITKVMFASGTTNAVHIDIKDGFSGGLVLDSCEILMREVGETFIKAGASVASTPIRIINGRLETRLSNPWTFADMQSGTLACNNLNFLGGNPTGLPNDLTRTAKIGTEASITFEECSLYENLDMYVDALSRSRIAARFDNCSFFGKLGTELRSYGYPVLNYVDATNGDAPISLENAINTGKELRRVIVDNPRTTAESVALPMSQGNSRSNKRGIISEIYRVKIDGNPCLDLQNGISLPPYSVITSVKIYATAINTANVDQIIADFYVDDGVGATTVQVWKDFVDATDVNGAELLAANTVITLPFKPLMKVRNLKATVLVTAESLLPNAWLIIEYKSITKRQDLGPDNTIPTKKLILATY